MTDTGPFVVLINRNDRDHKRCLTGGRLLPRKPLVTTWPCLTEAMYLLHRAAGHDGQAALWRWRADGRLMLIDLTADEVARMVELMEKWLFAESCG